MIEDPRDPGETPDEGEPTPDGVAPPDPEAVEPEAPEPESEEPASEERDEPDQKDVDMRDQERGKLEHHERGRVDVGHPVGVGRTEQATLEPVAHEVDATAD